MTYYRIFFEMFGTTQTFPPVSSGSYAAYDMERFARRELQRLKRQGKTCTLEKFDASVQCWVPV